MSLSPDQLNTAIIGVASLAVAGLSFIYASKAQQATRQAEAARVRETEVAVDAAAYGRARDLYESGIKALKEQNDGLREQVRGLQDGNDHLIRRLHDMDNRVAKLEAALRDAGISLPPWPEPPPTGGAHP